MLYRFHEFELDPKRFQLRRGGDPVPIPRQVFDLILFLVRNHERPVTRIELVSHVWGGRAISDASLSRCLFLARKALGDNPRQHRFIKTIHARGYWFVAPVEVVVEGGGGSSGSAGHGGGWPFVGREREVAIAGDAIRDVVLGARRALLVVGEPGIGKSRLITEVARSAAREGLFVASGSCGEVAGSSPSRGWTQVLESLWSYFGALVGGPAVVEGLARFGVAGAREAMVGYSSSLEDDVAFERARALDACSSFVRSCCRVLPTAILIDDLHRADDTSLDLLSLVISDAVDHELLVVGSARDPDPGRGTLPPKIVELSTNSSVTVLPLSRFGIGDVGRFVSQVDGGRLRSESEALLERSGGNPFYLSQIVSFLQASGEGAPDRRPLPPTVRELVLAHLGILDAELFAAIRMASVIGREFSQSLLSTVLGMEAEPVESFLEAAAGRGIVEFSVDDTCRFGHVLVQEALYSTLSRGEKGEAHLRVARALESALNGAAGTADASAIAHHRCAALPHGELDAAIDASVEAARLAYGGFALDRASEHCRLALSLLERRGRRDPERELQIRLELSKAQLASGLREEGRACLVEATRLAAGLEAGDSVAAIALSIAPGFLSIETGVVDEFLVERLTTALEIEALDPSLRARLTARLALALYWSPDRSRSKSLLAKAAGLAVGANDSRVEAIVSVYRTAATWEPQTFRERCRDLAELREAASASNDRSVELLGAVLRVTTLIESGDLSEADRGIAQLSRLVDDSGDPLARWYPIAMGAMRCLLAGRYAEAVQEVEKYSQLANRFGDANVDQTALMQLGEVAWQTGRAESVVESVRVQADRVRATPEWRCALSLVLALAHRESASLAEARSVLSELSLLTERINGSVGWAALAMATTLVRDESLSTQLYDWGVGIDSETIVGGYGMLCWGSRDFFLGVLAGTCGELGESERRLAAAVDANTRLGTPPWVAHARFALGELYRRRGGSGDAERANEQVAEAEVLARASGVRLASFLGREGR